MIQRQGILLLGAGCVTRGLAASEDHVQNAKQKERHSPRTCRAGVLQTVGMGDEVLEAPGS